MKQIEEFSVWPLMIDMLTSILIIIVLFSFFDRVLRPQNIEQQLVEMRKNIFYQEFQPLFRNEINQKKIAVTDKFDYLQINFSDNILFESASYRLNNQGELMLEKFRELIPSSVNNRGITNIQVEGHTDETSLKRDVFPKNNWELSAARALSVVGFLTEGIQGAAPALFSANGFGEFRPVSNDHKDNRRIEIKIFFSDKNNN